MASMHPTNVESPPASGGASASIGVRRASPSRLRSLVVMGVTAVAILAAVYMTNRPAAGEGGLTAVVLAGRATGPAPTVGKPAPAIAAKTVEGTPVSLTSFEGHTVWLTFGASWCQACRAEAPDIQSAYQRHKVKGLIVLSVFMQEDAATVRAYAQRVGLGFVKVADPQARIADEYRILGIPSHFFIDRAGVLRAVKVGSLDPTAMDDAIEAIEG